MMDKIRAALAAGTIIPSNPLVSAMEAIGAHKRKRELDAVRDVLHNNRENEFRAREIKGALLANGIYDFHDVKIDEYVPTGTMPSVEDVQWLKGEKLVQDHLRQYVEARHILAAEYEKKYWAAKARFERNNAFWSEVEKNSFEPHLAFALPMNCDRFTEYLRDMEKREGTAKPNEGRGNGSNTGDRKSDRSIPDVIEGYSDSEQGDGTIVSRFRAILGRLRRSDNEAPAQGEDENEEKTFQMMFRDILDRIQDKIKDTGKKLSEIGFRSSPPPQPFYCGTCYMCRRAARKERVEATFEDMYTGYHDMARAAYDQVKLVAKSSRILWQTPARIPPRDTTSRTRMMDAAVLYMWADHSDFEYLGL
ncbi:hypothetical protein F4861DRAFT_551985 [Xylaria intraflava]|nr:hypothetical protein F4861DRAFT_551985 [Xylaria intraflava]